MTGPIAADLVLQRLDLALARGECRVVFARERDPFGQCAGGGKQGGRVCGQGAQGECLATGDACERALGEFALVLGGDPFGARTGQAGLGVGELGSRAFAGTEPTAGDRRLGLEGIDLHACEGERLLGEQALHVGEAEAVEQFAAAGSEARARAFGLRLRRGVAAVRLEVEQGRAQLQRKDRVAVIEILGTWGGVFALAAHA